MLQSGRTSIEEASAAFNEQRKDKLDDAKVPIYIFFNVVDPTALRCVLCDATGEPDLHGAGWWLVGGLSVCPACIAEMDAEPAQVARRVGSVQRYCLTPKGMAALIEIAQERAGKCAPGSAERKRWNRKEVLYRRELKEMGAR